MAILKVLGICVFGLALTLPVYADRGHAAYQKGVRAEHAANLDAACGFYKQAQALSPKNPEYFMAFTETRFKAVNEHIKKGQLLRGAGDLENSLKRVAQTLAVQRVCGC